MTNVTPDQVPANAMIAGSNVWLDVDGLLKPRFGYTPLIVAGPTIGALTGLWWWIDLDSSNHYLAVSPTGVSTVQSGAWVTVTGRTLTGDVLDPVVFVSYFQNNAINVIFTDNADVLQVYNTSLATVQDLTPTIVTTGVANAYVGATVPTFAQIPQNTQFFISVPVANTRATTVNLNGTGATAVMYFSNGVLTALPNDFLLPNQVYNLTYDGTEYVVGTNIQAPACRGLAAITDRVVGVNVLNGAVRNYTQVTWTSAFDMTAWPALAFYNLVDQDDPLVSINPIGSFAAVIYGTHSATLMQAVQGVTDPFAFTFTPIQGVNVGPIGAQAVVVAQGAHWYLGTDLRVWFCDGSGAYPASAAIDAVLNPDINPALQSEVVGVYYPQYRQIWWWYPANNGTAGPTHAIIYSLDRGVFEPIQVFSSDIIRSVCADGALRTASLGRNCSQSWSSYTVPWSSFHTRERSRRVLWDRHRAGARIQRRIAQ